MERRHQLEGQQAVSSLDGVTSHHTTSHQTAVLAPSATSPSPFRVVPSQVKLLFHRIRPVFVFDGGAPALKARTLAARRKLRSEGTDSSLRKTAQRILASQLKKHKVCAWVPLPLPPHTRDGENGVAVFWGLLSCLLVVGRMDVAAVAVVVVGSRRGRSALLAMFVSQTVMLTSPRQRK